jgi:hypothetical protein
MGRCTKTIGERRLGRTIYKLGNSVGLAAKNAKPKFLKQKQARSSARAGLHG